MATKVTFTLDDQTIRRLESAAERLRKPKSEIVREAIGEYRESIGRLRVNGTRWPQVRRQSFFAVWAPK